MPTLQPSLLLPWIAEYMLSTYNDARKMKTYLLCMLVAGNSWGGFNCMTAINIVKCIKKASTLLYTLDCPQWLHWCWQPLHAPRIRRRIDNSNTAAICPWDLNARNCRHMYKPQLIKRMFSRPSLYWKGLVFPSVDYNSSHISNLHLECRQTASKFTEHAGIWSQTSL